MAEENPNRIQVEIVLDDGSIQRGFAKFTQAAGTAASDSSKKLSTIGDALNHDFVGDFKKAVSSIPITFGAALAGIAGAIGVTGFAIKKAFDLTLEGEKIKAVQVQFENFAHQAGISGEQLEAGLVKSAKGLISTDELLKTATSSIIELGASASRLPEVLDITRKATIALGGSLEERFDAVTRAIETGQTRLLRSQGIIIDQDKAFKEYAKTLGVAAGSLSKAQEQQAILNAFLTQAGDKFKDVKTGITPTNLAVKQISVSFKELHESLALFVNSTFGEAFANIAGGLASMLSQLVELKKFKSPLQQQTTDAADLRVAIIETENSIKNLNVQLGQLGKSYDDSFDRTLVSQKIADQTRKLSELKAKFKETGTAVTQTAKDAEEAKAALENSAVSKKIGLTEEQLKAQRDNANSILELQIKARESTLAIEQDKNTKIADIDLQQLDDQRLLSEQLEIIQTQRNEALLKLNDDYSQAKGFSDEQRRQAEIATQTLFDDKVKAANAKFIDDSKKKYQTLGSVAKQVFSSELGGAFQAFGAALVKGEDAMAAFGKAMIGIFGDIAIQLGQFYIAKGIALSADPLTPGAGGGLIAAGIGLNVLGGALKALSGGGGGVGVGSGGGDSGGGLSSDSSSNFSEFTDASQKERKPGEGLVVNILGDILGDEGSGQRLISLINASFDSTGISLRQGLV